MSHWSSLLPATKDTGSNPLGGLMWNRDSLVSDVSLQDSLDLFSLVSWLLLPERVFTELEGLFQFSSCWHDWNNGMNICTCNRPPGGNDGYRMLHRKMYISTKTPENQNCKSELQLSEENVMIKITYIVPYIHRYRCQECYIISCVINHSFAVRCVPILRLGLGVSLCALMVRCVPMFRQWLSVSLCSV